MRTHAIRKPDVKDDDTMTKRTSLPQSAKEKPRRKE
jgi:hypothetical protein